MQREVKHIFARKNISNVFVGNMSFGQINNT